MLRRLDHTGLVSTSALGLASPDQSRGGSPSVQGTHESLQTSLIPPNLGFGRFESSCGSGVNSKGFDHTSCPTCSDLFGSTQGSDVAW